MRFRKRQASVAGVIVAVLLAAAQWAKQYYHETPAQSQAGPEVYRVVQVYDGDTIRLNNGERIRLIGIDTPETHDNQKLSRDVARRHSRKAVQLQLGQAAAQYANGFLYDKDVRLEFDVEPRDRYKRLLAYVYLMDGTFVNKKIICDGYAYPLTIPPNVRHAEEFKACFDQAREQRRGLWQ